MNNDKSDTVAHFGNIIPTGLSTKTPSLKGFSPIQRVFLTASGTLQQILSAYHDTLVTVNVLYNTLNSLKQEHFYTRCVTLNNASTLKVLCIAQSKVYCTSQEAKHAVESAGIGIGQLFKYFGVIPEFLLGECGVCEVDYRVDRVGGCITNHDIGVDKTDLDVEDVEGLKIVFWRRYELRSKYLRCEIFEQFCEGCDLSK